MIDDRLFLLSCIIQNCVTGLLSALFRGTDLVPSDVMAGCVLLRVRQKRENLELQRLRVLNRPAYTSGNVEFPIYVLFVFA